MSQKQQVTHLFETDSERDHRHHCLSTNQLLRTANESSLQNSSRLEQLSTNQQQRLADETPLQRETRLSQVGPSLPLKKGSDQEVGVVSSKVV